MAGSSGDVKGDAFEQSSDHGCQIQARIANGVLFLGGDHLGVRSYDHGLGVCVAISIT